MWGIETFEVCGWWSDSLLRKKSSSLSWIFMEGCSFRSDWKNSSNSYSSENSRSIFRFPNNFLKRLRIKNPRISAWTITICFKLSAERPFLISHCFTSIPYTPFSPFFLTSHPLICFWHLSMIPWFSQLLYCAFICRHLATNFLSSRFTLINFLSTRTTCSL